MIEELSLITESERVWAIWKKYLKLSHIESVSHNVFLTKEYVSLSVMALIVRTGIVDPSWNPG